MIEFSFFTFAQLLRELRQQFCITVAVVVVGVVVSAISVVVFVVVLSLIRCLLYTLHPKTSWKLDGHGLRDHRG